ncbi:tetratricopeptide repeat-containing sensor histidine kinase [Parachryseolinea silvisoli]|uniref:tetratricopeptide repeat-containing sensor histidine kinase n=1 Tax=Parachryseolinea silvisoli TaxID=2873601 RepID=UPI002265F407|nr:tetratricopeptide repeat protein [Parachryseolinea silvisoli]MCD9015431.1 tetratricopeptide repeat protein [Parachryseolinea silvisoli]
MRFISIGCVVFLLTLSIARGQDTKLNSLRHALQTEKTAGNRYRTSLYLSHIGYYYDSIKERDSAFYYYKLSLSPCYKSDNDTLNASSLNALGTFFHRKGVEDSAIYHYSDALHLYRKHDKQYYAMAVEMNLAMAYKEIGLYEEADTNLLRALDYLERHPPGAYLVICYNTLGSVYGKTGDYQDALECYNKAMNATKAARIDAYISVLLNNKGETFLRLRQYDSALSCLIQAENIKRSAGDTKALGKTLNLLGETYMALGNDVRATSFLQEGLVINTAAGARTDQIVGLHSLIRLNLRQQRYDEARKLLDRAEALAREGGMPDYLRQLLEQRFVLYRATHRHDLAVQVVEELLIVKDSLLNKEKVKSLQALNIQYKTARKQEQIQALEKDKVYQKNWIKGLVGLAIGVTIMVFVIYLLYRSSQRNKKKAETLFKELNHRVKNNLQILSSVLSLQSQNVKDEDALQAIKSSESRVNAMALIHKKLYRDDNNRTIDMQEYVKELGDFLVHTYGFTKDRLQLHIQCDAVSIDVDKAIPIGLILNELVSNALKYAFDKHPAPALEIRLQETRAGEVQIDVRDNGVGMGPQKTREGAGSFGLKMVNMLIKELKGKVDVETQAGTAYHIVLPL